MTRLRDDREVPVRMGGDCMTRQHADQHLGGEDSSEDRGEDSGDG